MVSVISLSNLLEKEKGLVELTERVVKKWLPEGYAIGDISNLGVSINSPSDLRGEARIIVKPHRSQVLVMQKKHYQNAERLAQMLERETTKDYTLVTAYS